MLSGYGPAFSNIRNPNATGMNPDKLRFNADKVRQRMTPESISAIEEMRRRIAMDKNPGVSDPALEYANEAAEAVYGRSNGRPIQSGPTGIQITKEKTSVETNTPIVSDEIVKPKSVMMRERQRQVKKSQGDDNLNQVLYQENPNKPFLTPGNISQVQSTGKELPVLANIPSQFDGYWPDNVAPEQEWQGSVIKGPPIPAPQQFNYQTQSPEFNQTEPPQYNYMTGTQPVPKPPMGTPTLAEMMGPQKNSDYDGYFQQPPVQSPGSIDPNIIKNLSPEALQRLIEQLSVAMTKTTPVSINQNKLFQQQANLNERQFVR